MAADKQQREMFQRRLGSLVLDFMQSLGDKVQVSDAQNVVEFLQSGQDLLDRKGEADVSR